MYRILVCAWSLKHPKCFTLTRRGRRGTPYLPPSKEGGLPLYRILVCAWCPRHRKRFALTRLWPPRPTLPAPLERGGLTFVQNLSVCLVSQASKVFCPDTAVAAEAHPTRPPRKRGAFPLRRIPVTAWSPRHPKCFTLTVTHMAFAMRAFLCLCGFAGF